MRKRERVVVIGGGAAGFFGAITCAQSNQSKEVLLFEKSNKVLAKVKVSGGGRCNVTHSLFEISRFTKHYPRGEKALLALFKQFSAADTIRWFESQGVKLKAEADGRMFPVTDNSQTIIDCLWGEAKRLGVEIKTSTGITAIEPLHEPEDSQTRFRLSLQNGSSIECDKILVTTGGNPNPQAYGWLAKLGHTIQTPVPSLFTFNIPQSPFLELAGVAVPEAMVKVAGTKLEQSGPLLITHWGFSGPAILKLSAWGARILHQMDYTFTLSVNWLPLYKEESLRTELLSFKEKNPKKIVASNPLFGLPGRLWKRFTEEAAIAEELRWADLPKKNLNKLIETLIRGSFAVEGKSTFKEEFVTCGGVDLADIHLQTMESKRCKGLFFAGEVLDIDGITGGFNFQSAWTTGYVAGRSMALM